MRSERALSSGLSERCGGTEGKAWGNDNDRCGEQESKGHICVSHDIMKHLTTSQVTALRRSSRWATVRLLETITQQAAIQLLQG